MGKKMTDNLCTTRRQFLIGSGGTVATVLLSSIFPNTASAFFGRKVHLATYPEKKVARLSQLKTDKPIMFNYPHDNAFSSSLIVKLGRPASGGVGPKQDIVAFNTLCSHMGGPLGGVYQAEEKVLGPCPFHLSLFDLTRHGMVVAGHATEPLPQVVLEMRGNDIYAVGVVGLIYGHYNNLIT